MLLPVSVAAGRITAQSPFTALPYANKKALPLTDGAAVPSSHIALSALAVTEPPLTVIFAPVVKIA
jgi:hypothetical protein